MENFDSVERGTRLLVRSDLEPDNWYGKIRFDESMEKYKGQVVTVHLKGIATAVPVEYIITDDDQDAAWYQWNCWSAEMFERIINPTTGITSILKGVGNSDRKTEGKDKAEP